MAVVTPRIDEDIWQDVWDEERSWRQQPVEEQRPEPLALVIFGATGDLAHRKLIPALFSLDSDGLLPEKFAIVGFGRSRRSDEEYRVGLHDALSKSGERPEASRWQRFAERITYVQGKYDDEQSFDTLGNSLKVVEESMGTQQHRLFYLATPPNVYGNVVRNIGASGLNHVDENGGWSRLIVEKPFGHDLESAQELDAIIHDVFEEKQVYRIDHYLGKETVQNIFVLRFINGIFEPLWNRNYVEHVQITVSEAMGVEGRGGYYEGAGAIRDMLQSHILQLLTLTAMEPPGEFSADKVRDEKVKVLQSLRAAEPGDPANSFIRARYARGMVDGQYVPGYREEDGVSPASTTETFVSAKLLVDNWRWAGVPFYLRTGKRLAKRVSEIAIQFRRAPHMYLPGGGTQRPRQNVLVLRIQPDDGLALRLDVKVPGPGMRVRPVDMSFLYMDAFGGSTPEAYQRLLLDAMRGDSTLFARTDEVHAAWSLVTPVLRAWDNQSGETIPTYPAGTWGPEEADAMLSRDGHRWRTP